MRMNASPTGCTLLLEKQYVCQGLLCTSSAAFPTNAAAFSELLDMLAWPTPVTAAARGFAWPIEGAGAAVDKTDAVTATAAGDALVCAFATAYVAVAVAVETLVWICVDAGGGVSMAHVFVVVGPSLQMSAVNAMTRVALPVMPGAL